MVMVLPAYWAGFFDKDIKQCGFNIMMIIRRPVSLKKVKQKKFALMMIVLFYKVYSFYKKAYTESVQSGEITSEEFIKVSVWPFTVFIIFLIVEFTGLYLWFYMPFNL